MSGLTKRSLALTADLVARCERPEPDPGPHTSYRRYTDEDYQDRANRLLGAAPAGPLWVFAYGSLMWKPAVPVIEHRRAAAHGWHRAFCLKLRRWRGSPTQPGLMMGLKRGGSCNGVIHRIADADRLDLLTRLLQREVGCDLHMTGVRWVTADTGAERIRALAFWAEPVGLEDWVDLPLDQVACILARACGHGGSGAAYLFNTISKLDELGIRDRNLWRLQQLVAEEILSISPSVSAAAPQPFAR